MNSHVNMPDAAHLRVHVFMCLRFSEGHAFSPGLSCLTRSTGLQLWRTSLLYVWIWVWRGCVCLRVHLVYPSELPCHVHDPSGGTAPTTPCVWDALSAYCRSWVPLKVRCQGRSKHRKRLQAVWEEAASPLRNVERWPSGPGAPAGQPRGEHTVTRV